VRFLNKKQTFFSTLKNALAYYKQRQQVAVVNVAVIGLDPGISSAPPHPNFILVLITIFLVTEFRSRRLDRA
jgi:hypothetical protein